MTKDEVLHLAALSRIKLTEAEAETFTQEIDAILEYVSAVNEIVADSDLTKKVGRVHNVFREDVVTNQPGVYTEKIVDQFPKRDGDYLVVKKILNPEN